MCSEDSLPEQSSSSEADLYCEVVPLVVREAVCGMRYAVEWILDPRSWRRERLVAGAYIFTGGLQSDRGGEVTVLNARFVEVGVAPSKGIGTQHPINVPGLPVIVPGRLIMVLGSPDTVPGMDPG